MNGLPAELGQFPWLAVVNIAQPDRNSLCTGSLIRPDWVLTAAHCIHEGATYNITLGAIDRKNPGPTGISVVSSVAIPHPEYGPIVTTNDLGLIQLPYAVELNECKNQEDKMVF